VGHISSKTLRKKRTVLDHGAGKTISIEEEQSATHQGADQVFGRNGGTPILRMSAKSTNRF
jgi:hypothetical protein